MPTSTGKLQHKTTSPTMAPRISSKAPPRCLPTTTWQHLYYVPIDPHGDAAWPLNSFDDADGPAHVIEVLSGAASSEYEDFLRRKEISYVIPGEQQIDYQLMLSKLYELGIQRLMVGGGGTINWSLIQQDLVDEMSMILAPVANGDPTAPRFFTAKEPYTTIRDTQFELTHLE